MTLRLEIAAVLAAGLLLAGCEMQEFARARPDATPFAAADGDCWDYAGAIAPDDHQAMYAKCMARHGWANKPEPQ